jgi:hypothetical protein
MPTDTAEPGPRGGVLRHDHSPDTVGRVASLGLTTPQDVFGLRRSAQQAAAAVALDQQDQVRLTTALSELGRDRLGCRGLEVVFALDTSAQPMALVITFVWIGGPPPAQDTLDLAAKLVRIEHEAGATVSRIVVTQPLTAPGLTAADVRARLVKVLAGGARSTEADDLRAQTRDLVAALEETRAQRDALLRLNEELLAAAAGSDERAAEGTASACAVVRADLVVVTPVAEVLLPVELRGVLDLLLGEADGDLLLVRVDAHHRARREQDLLAEDPHTRVDHQVGVVDLVGVLVDLADTAVRRLDLESRQVGARLVARIGLVTPYVVRHAKPPLAVREYRGSPSGIAVGVPRQVECPPFSVPHNFIVRLRSA